MYLACTREMLNLLAGMGHVNLAKGAGLYMQIMLNLNVDHPWLSEQFCNELHSMRRTDQIWEGLWSDLVIEQFMMRSIKNRGGLTRGRGMAESTWFMGGHHAQMWWSSSYNGISNKTIASVQ